MELGAGEADDTSVLIAVESDQVREALVAMLGAIDGFRIVADANTAIGAMESARLHQPRLALIEPELSDCGGWWVIEQICAEELACVVVALGRAANGALAQMIGAQAYVQMGCAPRDLVSALQAAMSTAQAQAHLLPDADAVLEKPALVDL